nr:MAG TPA: Histo-aspartic protease-aspartic protease, HAP, Plasmepsin, Aspartic [Caudoviricetes sp.]
MIHRRLFLLLFIAFLFIFCIFAKILTENY